MPASTEKTPGIAGIAARRLRVQRLVGEPPGTPTDVVRHLLAVQSQDYAGAKWALAQRSPAGTTDAATDELFDRGEFVRTHVMRPTWHFVAAEDIRWLLAATSHRVHQASGFQYRTLGIDAALAARALDVFARTLEGGRAATREELGAALAAAGVDASGLRLGYFVMWAELEAVLCSGPRRGKRQTYALMDERVPRAQGRETDEALAELARRYVRGHGPAQDIDLAWWSGLTLTAARRALAMAEPAIRREAVDGRTFWIDPEEADAAAAARAAISATQQEPVVHLLPNYDELLIAFRDRSDAMDPALPPPARVAEAILAHIVVRNGLGVGGWKRRDGGASVAVAIDLLVELTPEERALVGREVERFEGFLGRRVEVTGLD